MSTKRKAYNLLRSAATLCGISAWSFDGGRGTGRRIGDASDGDGDGERPVIFALRGGGGGGGALFTKTFKSEEEEDVRR